ncbi:citrate synthase family protein [Leptospira yasudae]|uniref:citrate synthase (unknown stereospecificity) n=1 Tax=Leptospira yasudae TaxID=2202201 RepID=A0A6N4QV13_9LEPT|nr:citrate synthase family protein [Leptospira yasudae]TGL76298.1 helix-turn-helix domain-containing protein [Leptospira yasudae]TGL82448.1 helix-turn-helix domain-containing protein [Leptospira yasudae]TGL84380.1 helix-turn-helix domain-containing protein [Leptospira yasudae]
MKNSSKKPFLSALEAAQELGVEVETIYAYVSRGILHSEPGGSRDRSKRYRREEVERLLLQREEKLHPGKTARAALTFGQPVLESAITLIQDERLYYRGKNILDLAESYTFEQVCNLLWDTASSTFESPWPLLGDACKKSLPHLSDRPLIDLCRILLGIAEYDDTGALLKTPEALQRTASRIVRLLCLFASRTIQGRMSIAETLWSSWKNSEASNSVRSKSHSKTVMDGKRSSNFTSEDKKAVRLIEASLILSADHELNVSSFTARCVASSDASLYQAVIAGLAALSGRKHGLLTEKTIELLESASVRKMDAKEILTERLRRGETIPGFGHPFYKNGDPRGKKLMELCERLFPKSKEFLSAKRIIDQATELLGDYPTIDAGLAVVSRTLKLPKGAGLALFAIGRSAGWMAHSMEQYQTGQLIRPRARYNGVAPETTSY